MLARVALDENLHMLFYRNLLGAALELEPNAAMIAIKDVVTNFQMPGAGMPGWGRKSVQIALAGIYDPKSHIEDVVAPVLRAWNIFNRELAKYLADAEVDVAKFVEKRDNHFDRLEARGQNPIRLKD
jgi:acyl-[acyl-carrier-protein] desaturase